MSLLETYLRSLRVTHFSGAGVKETSHYGTLADLFNSAGKNLDPQVHCILQLTNRGAGFPDFGLFTSDQLPTGNEKEPLLGLAPARGVIEAKGTGDDVRKVAQTQQVRDYLGRYGQVLVTNLRDFLLVQQDEHGKLVLGEDFRLAAGEAEFWASTSNPKAVADELGERFEQYLRRVMLHPAPLTSPKDLAFFLASYARDALARIERSQLPGLRNVRDALEDALGLRFEGERGDHFFRSTFVQTLFYGIFSAWVLWSKQRAFGAPSAFRWQSAMWELRVPAISVLFEQVAIPSRLKPLGLDRVLDWTEAVLNRVDRAAFFARFEEDHAVQYFYEPFLEAFDPNLRKELGVWYTPPEVVEYMVTRVETVLRQELGVADGLADPRVYVLDPCTGTGSYLIEVLRRIEAALRAKGDDALLGSDLKRAATERIFGFEILPAPFVVAHLQLGLLLQNAGAPLSPDGSERAGVYLTNALTGWDAQTGEGKKARIPELDEEREAAAHVKRDTGILVVLGNPPYNGFAGVAVEDERALSDAYRVARRTKQPQGQGLNDLYVRFFRMAERRIAEMTGQGVVCLISNYSWLDGLSFTAMRERYLDAFDGIWIDSLNGDKYRTGKLTPDRKPDPSIFSTPRNREGIQVGTAIALLVRKGDHAPTESVRFRNLWGTGKLAQLRTEAASSATPAYELLSPPTALGLPFLPTGSQSDYVEWPALPALMPVSFPGVKTSRDDFVVDIDRARLIDRMTTYFNPNVSHAEMRRIAPGAMESTGRFRAEQVRDALRGRGFLPDRVVRYAYRPFDNRWLYWEPETKLLDEKRPEYFPRVFPDNFWIEARQKQTGTTFSRGMVTNLLADNQGNGLSNFFPLYRERPASQLLAFGENGAGDFLTNLSPAAAAYLTQLDADARELFFHIVAILHAPPYRRDNADALRQDWPRIPLPGSRDLLLASAALGRQVAALLDPDQSVPGVTRSPIRPELKPIAAISRVGGGALDPNAGDLLLTANWGYRASSGATMAGSGKAVPRAYAEAERRAIEDWGNPLALSLEETFAPLGESTYDVYINDRAFWRNVPANVWTYTLGGYQVMKKWLSYREFDVLGRSLTDTEAREVQNMARRVAALLLLGPRLAANYQAVQLAAHQWEGAKESQEIALRLF